MLAGVMLLVACTSTPQAGVPARTATPSPSPARTVSTPTPTPTPTAAPRFDGRAAERTVVDLAGRIGPREATTPAFARAASYVERRLRDLGYEARRQSFAVPAGVSWGVRVPAGRTHNVVALPRGFRPDRPHLIVGAHLDTVPQAPGAEDNASGVAVLLELARLAAAGRAAPSPPLPATPAPAGAAAPAPALPVIFIAFAAEEPRGPADDEHHFGSRHYVATMSTAQRRALVGMVSLDRVGVGSSVRVCTGGRSDTAIARAIRAAAARIKVLTSACENRTSDHWPFEKAGETVARVGGHPYAAYHSARDRPAVVQRRQLDRTGRVMWEFLTTLP